jgi:probable rRNA maturation factor
MASASFRRKLKLYPATVTEMGSPQGARWSKRTVSPGTQPISMSFSSRSLSAIECILPMVPGVSSDNFLIISQRKCSFAYPTVITISEMKSAVPPIHFYFLKPATLRDRRRLKAFILQVFRKHRQKLGSLNVIFCSDDYLIDINRQHLNHDYYTDIITFNLADAPNPIEGEIYISIDRVRDNSVQAGTSFSNELHRVIFHGVLHLCGFKDKSARDKAEMTRQENLLLANYAVPRNTVSRRNNR